LCFAGPNVEDEAATAAQYFQQNDLDSSFALVHSDLATDADSFLCAQHSSASSVGGVTLIAPPAASPDSWLTDDGDAACQSRDSDTDPIG
jgi:hypothetical protein